jgi:hypothetical protein
MTPDWAAKTTAVPYAVFGNPQTLNLYVFVRDNPESYADLDGHQCSIAEGPAICSDVNDDPRDDPSLFQDRKKPTVTVQYLSGDNPDPQSHLVSAQSGSMVTYELTISPALPKGDGTIQANLAFDKDGRPAKGEIGLTDNTATKVTAVVAHQSEQQNTTTIRTTVIPYETRNDLGGNGLGRVTFTVTASDGAVAKGSAPVWISTPPGKVPNRNTDGTITTSSPFRTSLIVHVP